jgi:hypothetical protein
VDRGSEAAFYFGGTLMSDQKKNRIDQTEVDLSNQCDQREDQNDSTELYPFNPAALRLPQDFTETASVEKLLETIPVGRFNKQDFFRTHPDPTYRLDSVGLLELKDDREYYLVPPAFSAELADEFDPVSLFTCVNRKGVLRLIPVKLPRDDRRGRNEWATSLRSGLERGMTQWVRVVPNMSLGAYEISVALNGLPDPAFPNLSFREILRIAFRDRIIDREDHPVIQLLRGAA